MELKKIITAHPEVLNNVAMFKGILLDTYNQPENKGKINLLLNAYEIHITDEITQNDLDDVFVERMKKKLVSTYSVTDNSAEWAVKTWCSEYGNGMLGKEISFSVPAVDDKIEEITTPNTAPVIENSKQLVLKDGTLYEGEVFADIPHGCGKAEYKNGDVYKGYWNRGLRSGQGVLIYENGTEWTGEFKDDKFWDGKGYKYYNDSVYEGEWKNGKSNGKGKLVWNNGGEWIGEFKDGERWNGSGIDRYEGGTYYDGPLIEGKSEGFGKYYYATSFYEGEWKNGKKHGQGKQVWNDGGEWVGEFKDGSTWNGQGKMLYTNYGYYVGEIKNGERSGQGKYLWFKGGEWCGEFKDDKLWNGQGVVRFYSDGYYDGAYVNGKRHGKGEFFWNAGGKWSGEYKDDKAWNGNGTMRYSNADYYYVGEFRDGEKYGVGKLYWNDGRVTDTNKYPETKTTQNANTQGGCYIATCVYGSYDCPQVWTLRRYRDKKLANTWYGRIFIKIYYAISPTLVKLFGNTNWFKCYWKNKLDKMVLELQSNGFDNTFYEDKI